MDLSFNTLASGISSEIEEANVTKSAVDVAESLLKHRTRFLLVQQLCQVPALWLMPVFQRENPSFTAYFGNGDPLDKPTTHVPKHRGPFATWEDGVVDSLKLDHITSVKGWTWVRACYEWEAWNGFGVREYHGRPTGYVWAWTNVYQGGKYLADGKWSRGTWDTQPGCFAVAKAIAALDEEIGKGLS